MKTPEEWNKEMVWSNMRNSDVIKQIQTEAWNEAIDEAAENADLRDICADDGHWYQDKQSILKLKK